MGGCEANERKILVGVDEGDESMYALSWCLKNVVVPQNSKDTLVLLYAQKPRPIYPIIDGATVSDEPKIRYILMPDVMETMDRYNNELAESRMEKAKRLCKEVHNLDVKVETRIESGDPRDVICQAAEKLSADVVVLGSHGYGLIKR
ncbi:hypothetical protein HYC85_004200 [Camellia sinensis]|uniref:UspA domain-containing protein n=1 Tax=Camellia sinensis TaxID=4442 RepID=A0A7J7HWU2_CAMSI|nr:hypothetical protein HYC85_004200 [Camellia sinensis]